MALAQLIFSDAFRDLHHTMNTLDQTFFGDQDTLSFWNRYSLADPVFITVGGNNRRRHHHRRIHCQHFRFPATDMSETESAYELTAELPGYEKKNISIELTDSRTLVLSGSTDDQQEVSNATTVEEVVDESNQTTTVEEVNENSNEESNATTSDVAMKDSGELTNESSQPQYWFKERVSGSFSRSFTFPTQINPDTIKASFENGILKVTVPKTMENKNRQITIA